MKLIHIAQVIVVAISLATHSQAAPILRASSHDMQPECKYELVFDRAVVSETEINQALENKWLSISPALPGKIVWKSRNTAEFLPDQAPKMDTKYQFSIPKKLSHADGTTIPSIPLLAISTPRFQIDYHRKSYKTHDRLPLSYLRFNDDINPEENQKLFVYKSKEGVVVPAEIRQATWEDVESTYYIVPSWEKRFQNVLDQRTQQGPVEAVWKKGDLIPNGLIVTPKDPLPIGKEWMLIAQKDIANLNKKHKTLHVSSYSIWDIEPFKVKKALAVVRADEPREVVIEFNASIADNLTHEQLAQLIKISPQPKNFKLKYDGDRYDSSRVIVAEGDFNSQDTWRVDVSDAFTAQNGLSLARKHSKELVFKHLRTGISLPAFNVSQLARGERSFHIDTLNLKEIQISIKRLNREQAIRAQQGYRHYSGEGRNYASIPNKAPLPFELISGETIYNETIALDNPIDTTKKVTLLWDQVLKSKDTAATLFISVTGEPKDGIEDKLSKRRIAQSIVQLTDLGLAWKFSEDQAWIYCYSLETGEPIADADLLMVGSDSTQLQTAKTDNQGLATITRSAADHHLVVSKGSDQMMVAFDNSLDTVSMWHFPVDYSWNPVNFWKNDMMIFSDRSLYRPNETVRLKGILREFKDNEIRLTKYTTATLQVTRDDKELLKQTIEISANGSFDFEHTLPAEHVGHYTYSVTLPEVEGDKNQAKSFYHRVLVQDFRRNSFEIASHLPATKTNDKHVQLDLNAKYYQGAPVADGSVEWYFTADQTGYYPEKFRDYLFCDHRDYDPYYWSHYFGYNEHSSSSKDSSRSNGKAILDNNGAASVSVEIPPLEFPSPQLLKFHSEITDSRDQTLTNTAQVTHYSTELYFGISRLDQLVRVNEEIPLNIVAVNLKGDYTGKPQTANLTITREYNETVKIQATDGSVSTQNEEHKEEISRQEVVISGDQPTAFPFKTEKPGRYIIQITGADEAGNKTVTASSFYVYGSDEYPWATEEGIRIKLIPEKPSYRPGDTAKILIMTPIEGRALISVERQGVIKTFQRELKTDNPVIEIPIEEGYAPNAYISVLVMRGTTQSPHKHKEPALKLGYCSINVENPAKQLAVAIQAPSESVRPGEKATVSGTVTDHLGKPVAGAEVVLYAEDEGTLAVMGYDDPAPLSFFHAPRPLTLTTGVSLAYFLDENPEDRFIGNKGFIIGGGDGYEPSPGELPNVALRKNFNPCAFWAPTLTTDANGNFNISFTTPDSLTRYRVLAVAMKDADRFGSARSSLVVNKDLMLEPKPPRFAHEGDALQSKVLVQNTSKFSGTWEVSLRGDSLSRVDSSAKNTATQRIDLAAGASATLSFDVSFLNTGETTWTWTATPVSLNNSGLDNSLRARLSDSMENRFNVAYPRPLLREAAFFVQEPNADPVDLAGKFSPALMGGRGHVDLEFSNSLLLEAGGAVDYLLHYPYGCAEQTTSSLMPWFAVRDLKKRIPGFSKKSDAEVAKAIQTGVDRLLSMQTESGGIGYWPGDKSPTDWASSYGGMALVMAKEQGAHIPDSSLNNLAKYLAASVRTANTNEVHAWDEDTHCRSLYVLAMMGKAEVAEQNKRFARRQYLSSSSRAMLALAIHLSGGSTEDALELLTMSSANVPSDHWMKHRADIPSLLLAWSTIAPKDKQSVEMMSQLISSRNRQGHWHTTWVNGWAMYAMATYARNVENHLPEATITLTTADGPRTISLTQDKPIETLRLSTSEAQKLMASSNGQAYIRVAVAAKPEIAPNGPVSKEGIAIHRSYERALADGTFEPLTHPKVGDLVRVNLAVTFPGALDYVVIDDTLPSVMETVNNDFASQSSHVVGSADRNYNVSRMELRDDRAVFFLNRSWRRGTETLSYMARVTSSGTVHVPPAKVEAMYNPSQYGLSDTVIFTVSPKKR